jgi:hypothetical protein
MNLYCTHDQPKKMFENTNNITHSSLSLNVCDSLLIAHALKSWTVYDVVRIVNVAHRRMRVIGLHPTQVLRTNHLGHFIYWKWLMTEKCVGYIQASHTVSWGRPYALLHPIAYGAGKINVCDSLPIIHALQSWTVCDGARIANVTPQNSACDGTDNRHEQQGWSVWDRWYIGNSYLTTSAWNRCSHHIRLIMQNVCIPTPYRIWFLGRVGWTPLSHTLTRWRFKTLSPKGVKNLLYRTSMHQCIHYFGRGFNWLWQQSCYLWWLLWWHVCYKE